MAVFAVAAALRLAYLIASADAPWDLGRHFNMSDMHTFHHWALAIAEGDVLGDPPPHPYHGWWQTEVGPPELWNRWYQDGKAFHQAPLYPYLVASVYALAGPDTALVRTLQALVGALGCVLVFAVTWQLTRNRAVSTGAGLLMAFYGPGWYYETLLLRDAIAPTLGMLAVWATACAARPEASPRRALVAGAAWGLYTLCKINLLFFMLGSTAWLLLRGPRPHLRRAATGIAMLAAGYLLVLSPAVARNLMMGVSPFTLTTRGPTAFVVGNAAGVDGTSWTLPDDTRRILREADYSLPGVVARTLATHSADPVGLVRLQLRKLDAILNGHELANNADFYHMRHEVSLLRTPFALPYAFFSALGLWGMCLAWGRRRELAPLYIYVLAMLASCVAFYVLSRFRQVAVPAFAIFAAIGAGELARRVQERERGRIAVAVLLLAVCVALTWTRGDTRAEPDRYLLASHYYGLIEKDPEGALRAVELGLEVHPGDDALATHAGWVGLALGRLDVARRYFELALQVVPNHAYPCIGMVQLDVLAGAGESARARVPGCLELPGADETARVWRHAAEIELRTGGDPERARGYAERALDMTPLQDAAETGVIRALIESIPAT